MNPSTRPRFVFPTLRSRDEPSGFERLATLRAHDLGFAVLVGLILTTLAALYSGPASGDDTFIYMRIVGNIIAGNGWVYNPGEASYGTTSPLWAGLMLPIVTLFGNGLGVWKSAGIILFGSRIALLFLLFRRLGATVAIALALVVFAAADAHTIRWFGSGMENSLTAFAFTAQFFLLIEWLNGRRRIHLLALALASAVLPFARPEYGLWSILTFVIVALFGRNDARSVLVFGVASAIIGGLLVAVSYWATGFLLPQTGTGKSIFLLQESPVYALRQSAIILFTGSAGGLAILAMPWKRVDALLVLRVAVVLILAGIVLYMHSKNHLVSTRYATTMCTPILLCSAIVMLYAWHEERWKKVILCLAVVLQLAAAAWALRFAWPATRVVEEDRIRVVAEAANELLPADARVALTEIGIFGFYYHGYVIDMVGLVDPATLEWGREHGRYRTQGELEQLLLFRGATHYVRAFGESPLRGEGLHFDLLGEWPVVRANLSQRRLMTDTWRLYELQPIESD